MKQLRRMNVHHASLFPDLHGAADYCNLIATEEQSTTELQEIEYKTEVANLAEKYLNLASGNPENDNLPLIINNDSVTEILESSANKQVEPPRLSLMADKLDQIIKNGQAVDWESRENVQASIRNKMRISLRKLGYPEENRDKAIQEILDLYIKESLKNKS